jgi:hypothetical protein
MNISDTVLLRVELAGLLDLFTDWLSDPGELPGRHAGEHPVHHRSLQRVPTSEVLIGRDRQLALIVS